MGYDVKVVNPLPRMPRYAEARRSTMMGVSKAPRGWKHQGVDILVPRFFALPDHPYPRLTVSSIARRAGWVEKKLGSWRPDLIVCHTLWPVAQLAERLAARWECPWVGVVHGHDFDVGLSLDGVGSKIADSASTCAALVCASERLSTMANNMTAPPKRVETIPCLTSIHKEWRRPVNPMKKAWKKNRLMCSFPQTLVGPKSAIFWRSKRGSARARGWMVGITSLRHQPRDIVYDRMLTADVPSSRLGVKPVLWSQENRCFAERPS